MNFNTQTLAVSCKRVTGPNTGMQQTMILDSLLSLEGEYRLTEAEKKRV
jgi:hypothetical protein